jgi:hypothetical protein
MPTRPNTKPSSEHAKETIPMDAVTIANIVHVTLGCINMSDGEKTNMYGIINPAKASLTAVHPTLLGLAPAKPAPA